MAIKTQGGKVITKGGKVSCECCGFFCFFYPSIGIRENLYTAEDLPDFVNIQDLAETYLFEKNGDAFFSTETIGALAPGGLRIIIFDRGGPIWTPGTGNFDLVWSIEAFNGSTWEKVDDSEFRDGLFETVDFLRIEDLFAETYTVTGIFNGSADSKTVTRTPPPFPGAKKTCFWVGDGVTLKYNGGFTFFENPQFTFQGNFKFQVNGNNKSGFQNTPVGSYAGGYTVT
jgi:hypothetical protein